MRLSVTVEGREHWVEWRDDAVMTRRALREFYLGGRTDDDAFVLERFGAWASSCCLTDTEGREYASFEEMDGDALDGLHPAVLRWLYQLPRLAADEQASLGEAKSRR